MENKKNFPWMFPATLLLIFLLILYVVSSIDAFRSFGQKVSELLRPIVIGLVLAYICNPLFRFLETRIFFKVHPFGLRRGLSLFFTYLIFFAGIVVFLLIIIPQVIDSVIAFLANYESYLESAVGTANDWISKINRAVFSSGPNGPIPFFDTDRVLQSLDGDTLFNIIFNEEGVSQAFDIASGFLSFAKNTLFGFFVSLYLLSSKEKRYAQIMRMRRSLFSKPFNRHITKICSVTNRAFGRFLGARLLGSAFVGGLTYCVTAAFSVPYAPLLSVSVGLLAFLPLVGPISAVLLAALILLLVDPAKVLPIVLILILIFQLNKRLIIAKFMPDSGRISSLCIVVAIATVGMVWGLPGLILAVPLFATVTELLETYAEAALKKKKLPEDTAHYAANPVFDPETDEEDLPKEQESESIRTSDIFELAKRYRMHRFRAIPPAEDPPSETESPSSTDQLS